MLQYMQTRQFKKLVAPSLRPWAIRSRPEPWGRNCRGNFEVAEKSPLQQNPISSQTEVPPCFSYAIGHFYTPSMSILVKLLPVVPHKAVAEVSKIVNL